MVHLLDHTEHSILNKASEMKKISILSHAEFFLPIFLLPRVLYIIRRMIEIILALRIVQPALVGRQDMDMPPDNRGDVSADSHLAGR